MTYTVSVATASDASEWDGFARAQRGFTHFHLFGWLKVISSTLGSKGMYLIARDNTGAIGAVLPLFRVKSMLFGDFLVSMPFLNYGGPLGSRAGVLAVVEHARRLADSLKVDLLELRCREEQELELPVSTRKITVVMDIPAGGSEELWKRFDTKVRTKIRRPMKEAMEVRYGSELIPDFYALFSHLMRDLGTPVLPRSFFESAAREFGESMWVGVAYHDGKAVACGCGFEWGTEYEMTWSASPRVHSKLGPNMLLYWSFMERAAQRGITVFNFGRCTPDSGTHKFKQQWNSRDEQLYWYQHSLSHTATTPSPDGKYSLGPRIWRHLPLPVATLLGPHIVRNIP